MKNLLLFITMILTFAACDTIQSSQIPSEPTYATGSVRRSAPTTLYERSTACGTGWTAFHTTFEKPLPFDNADKDKNLFQIGATSTGLHTWAVLNNGTIVSDTTKMPFYCTKD